GYIDIAEINIGVSSNGELDSISRQAALNHEKGGHASGLDGHALTLSQDKTIMVPVLININ
ncbi:MAG: hypothetical protein QME66_13150, partial [Candidatus Eisenbacteria bacterium]|nr:hypothetical protein [Candidatus Eisenbacteria bacterium]